MKKTTAWRFALAIILFVILAQIFNMLDALVSMDYYKDPAYFSLWSKYMMPQAGPPPQSFYYMSIAVNLIGAIIFTLVYSLLQKGIPGSTPVKKGLVYGLLMFLVAGVTGMLAMLLLLNLPAVLIGLWTAEDLLIKVIGGVVVAMLVSPRQHII